MTDKPPPAPEPDGWNRFERAVDMALHTPSKPNPKVRVESKAARKKKA